MSPAQQLVLRWFEFSLATAILLVVARLILSRLKQPADRVNLILLSFAMAALIPVMGILVPLPRVELGLVEEVRVNTELPVGLPEIHPLPVKSPSYGPVGIPKDLPDIVEPVVPLDSVPSVASTEETQPVPQSFVGFLSNPFWEMMAGLLILLHLLVAGSFLVEWWISSRVLSGICKLAQGPQPFLLALWQEISQGKGSSVCLLVSGEIPGPIAFGFWKATIVIPESIAAGNADSIRFCLKHEWTHIENGDLRALGFAWVCQFLLWIQPLFWLLRRDLRVCQDFLADHQAAGEGLDRVEYSQLLLDFTKLRLTRPIPGTIAFFDRSSHLMKRVRMILESDFTLRLKSHRWFRLGAGAGLLGLAVLFGAVRLHGAGSGAETHTRLPEATIPASENQDGGAEDKEFKWIRGAVVDQKGQPVPEAKLALPLSKKSVTGGLPAKTDAMGKFEIKIPKKVFKELLNPLKRTLWVYASGFNVAGESIDALVRGSKESIDIQFQLTSGSKFSFTVLDPKGVPLPGAKVQILQYRFQKEFEIVPGNWIDEFSTQSDAKGVAQFSGIQPEHIVSLQIQAEKYGTQTIILKGIEQHSNWSIQLKETGTIKGRLVSDHPEWVRGIPIFLSSLRSADPDSPLGSAHVVTDQTGFFEVPYFPANCQIVPRVVLKPDLFVLPAIEETPWSVKPGATLKMEIPLVPATKVRGVLRVKSKGTPVGGAEIVLSNGDFKKVGGWEIVELSHGAFRQYDRVVTDGKGQFEAKVLAGPVKIQILSLPSENLVRDPKSLESPILVPKGSKESDLPPIEVLETKEWKGKLVGAKNQPLPGMELQVRMGNFLASETTTGPEGQFAMKVPDGVEFAVYLKTHDQRLVRVQILQKEPLLLQYSGDLINDKTATDRGSLPEVTLKGQVLLGGKPV